LAFVTQPFGNGGTKKKQQDAIKAGMNAVCRPVDARTFKRSSGGLNSPEEIDQWVDEHRGRNGHARLGGDRKAICRKADFNKALRARKTRAGMAKGSWIGAGQRLARRQRGAKRINIGKNFLSWTHRHANKGRGAKVGGGDNTTVLLTNNTTGAAKNEGLSMSAANTALNIARKSVFAYYSKRLRSMKIKGRGTR